MSHVYPCVYAHNLCKAIWMHLKVFMCVCVCVCVCVWGGLNERELFRSVWLIWPLFPCNHSEENGFFYLIPSHNIPKQFKKEASMSFNMNFLFKIQRIHFLFPHHATPPFYNLQRLIYTEIEGVSGRSTPTSNQHCYL